MWCRKETKRSLKLTQLCNCGTKGSHQASWGQQLSWDRKKWQPLLKSNRNRNWSIRSLPSNTKIKPKSLLISSKSTRERNFEQKHSQNLYIQISRERERELMKTHRAAATGRMWEWEENWKTQVGFLLVSGGKQLTISIWSLYFFQLVCLPAWVYK